MSWSWETADMADGRIVAAWLRKMAPRCIEENQHFARRVHTWEHGGNATIRGLDNMLTKYCPHLHLNDVPDEAWLEPMPGGHSAPRRDVPRDLKAYCVVCGEEISPVAPSGKRRGPAYMQTAKFCGRKCQGEHRTQSRLRLVESKECPVCGDRFGPRRTESPGEWATRRCCSKSCAAKARKAFSVGREAA